MDDFYVYAHVDKENQVPFYIGKGRGRRAYSKERHDYWSSFVLKYAQGYEVKFIATDISEYYANEIENYFIDKLGKIYTGQGLLLNWTDGGFNEGVFIKIGFEEDTIEIEDKLTEFGQNLFITDKNSYDISKCNLFINDIANDTTIGIKNKLLEDINKASNPRDSWIVSFCLSETSIKSDLFNLKVTNRIELIEKINNPIDLLKLPIRPYVDNITHRIMIYFDILLQENVQLAKNDKIISRSEPDWYFYKDYWHGYIKIIQCIYGGKELKIKYSKKNKVNHQREDIHDFEVSVIKAKSKN